MTSLTPHATTAGRPSTRREGHTSARAGRKRRSFDAVFASYIRELAAGADATSGPATRAGTAAGRAGARPAA
jgi:hypothetical protein